MNDQKEYEAWCQNPYFDEETRKELLGLKKEDIRERFAQELTFGTGGLRGIMGAGLNRMNRYTVRRATQGLADYIRKQHLEKAGVAIAYDSRHQSPEFAMDAALCLCANGIKTYLFDSLRPTPELSFAVRDLKCGAGIVITASHNPREYNGYKVYWEDGAQITSPRDREIIEEVKGITRFDQVKTMAKEEALDAGLLHFIGGEIDERYIQALTSLVLDWEAIRQMASRLKIVYTPLHGTGNVPVRQILRKLGFEHVYVVAEQEQPDGDFPTVESPNPENPEAFFMALELAERVDADLVLATDPDADRLGVYARDERTGSYVPFTGNMTGMLLCEYVLSRKQEQGTLPENGAIITTIVSGKMAAAAAEAYHMDCIETLTGFKYIGEQIRQFEETRSHKYLFGFEESYGCLAGTYSRDKDGVGAVMLLCEAAAYYRLHGISLCRQMDHLYEKYGYYKEILHTVTKKGTDGSREIRRLMEELRANPPSALGGKKVLEFRDYKRGRIVDGVSARIRTVSLPSSDVLYFSLENRAWACIRPSGTEPKVKIYLGAAEADLTRSGLLLEALWEDLQKQMRLNHMVGFQMEALPERLIKPLEVLGRRFGFCQNEMGRILTGEAIFEDRLSVRGTDREVRICYGSLSHFLRGVGMAVRREQEGIRSFTMEEEVNFTFSGLMLDCSRNGVVSLAYAKEMMERLAMMGHNVFMLYMEDVYEVEGEPYFGYLRGRYSREELKELDDYADMLGLELIPCIQTLAHLDQFLIWEEMAEKYLDIDNILYVGNPSVLSLLDRILRMFSQTLRSKRIHLGMDEAYHLGRGRYGDEHGLRQKPQIMLEHLKAVMELSRKYGLRPMIWDDMFFSSYSKANPGQFSIPEGIDLMYWDYYHNTESHYTQNIAARSKITKHLMFAGGAWRWTGYAPHHSKTLAASNASLTACKKAGVTEVIVTAWADDGCESPVSTCLFGCVLFGEHAYHQEFRQEEFQKNVKFYTGLSYEATMKQEEFDILPQYTQEQRTATVTPSKYSFYEDPLCSKFVLHERALREDVTAHYQALGEYFTNAALTEENLVLKASHEFYGAFGRAMSLKWNLGMKLYDAYQAKDRAVLRHIVDSQMRPLEGLLEDVRVARMKEWYLTNKSYGFEVLDLRIGGMKQRIATAVSLLEQYLDGSLETVAELEEARLPAVHFREEGMGDILHYNRCQRIMTPSRMTW